MSKVLKFDETNLSQVAGLVKRLNPNARSVADLVAYMKQTAQQCLADHPKPSYCGTLGFMLTSYDPEFDESGARHVKASIDVCAFHGVEFTVQRAN